MKIDLDDLEANLREAMAPTSDVTVVLGREFLATIARVRELEAGYRSMVDDFAVDMEDPGDLAHDRALLEKGVTVDE